MPRTRTLAALAAFALPAAAALASPPDGLEFAITGPAGGPQPGSAFP